MKRKKPLIQRIKNLLGIKSPKGMHLNYGEEEKFGRFSVTYYEKSSDGLFQKVFQMAKANWFVIFLIIVLVFSMMYYAAVGQEFKAELDAVKQETDNLKAENETLKEKNDLYFNRITELTTELEDTKSKLEELESYELLPVSMGTFYASDEPMLGSRGASGNELTDGKSVALNKPIIDAYGLSWGDTIIVRSENNPELNGSYILEDCGVGCNETIDFYLDSTAQIPSYGRAHDLKVWAA